MAVKAAVLNTQPGELDIEDLVVDKPGPGEVLVRTVGAGLCHSDLHFMEGVFRLKVPAVLGHESAGVVEAVGEGVAYVKPGDHVVCCLSIFCGSCRQCLSGFPNRCTNPAATTRPRGATSRLSRHDGTPVGQFARLGGFAEMMLIHENGVVKVTDDLPLDKVALIGCGILTGSGAVFRTAGVEPGSRVCVIGAGGIGLAAIQAARIAGAGDVIVVDVSDAKLETAKQLGATATINASEVDNVVEAVRELTGGGVDYSFEAIGKKATAEQAFKMLDLGGTATIIGMVPDDQRLEIKAMDLLSEKRLQGSMMGSNQFRTDIPRLIRLYLDGRLDLDSMVSKTLSLEEVNEGYGLMKRGEVARSVISFPG
jgi:S-(hydroxymethyl)glutathione dehydrogenase / alcohol dehydrogenase